MADAHFTVIRVGESVWSTWEPENGRFDLDWLQPVLDGAHERGIAVVLGTPDLRRAAVAGPAVPGDRRRAGAPGSASAGAPGRRSTSPTRRSGSTPSGSSARSSAGTPTTRRSSGSRSTTSPGNELLHNHGVFQRFVDHLRAHVRRRRDPQPRMGPGLLVAPPVHLGRPVDARTATPSRSTTSPGGAFQARPDHRVHRLAGRHRPRVRPPRPVRHHLHLLRPARGATTTS